MRNRKMNRPEKEYSIIKMVIFFIAGLVAGFLVLKFFLKL